MDVKYVTIIMVTMTIMMKSNWRGLDLELLKESVHYSKAAALSQPKTKGRPRYPDSKKSALSHGTKGKLRRLAMVMVMMMMVMVMVMVLVMMVLLCQS